MKTAKTRFQEELNSLEDLLVTYKSAPPQNVGMLFREKFSYFLMLLSIFLALDTYLAEGSSFFVAMGGLFNDHTEFSMICCIAPVVFFFGVIIWNKSLHLYADAYKLADTTALKKEFEKMKKKYAEYPDVAIFLEKFHNEFVSEKRRKNIVKVLFLILFWGFFGLYGFWIYKGWSRENTQLRNYFTTDNYCQILQLKADKPFLTIEPLKPSVADFIALKTGAIDVYLYHRTAYYTDDTNDNLRSLYTTKPEMYGNSVNDTFRLTITDESGQPIDGCPDFVFTATGDTIIRSCDFRKYAYSKQYNFQALYILKYLQDNQEHLRYVVEKL